MKKILLFLLIFIMIFTTACWDKIEINQRIFPYSVGLDLNEEKDEDKDFIVTFSYPNINSLGKNATSDEKVFMLSTKANDIFEATHNLSNKAQQPIYLKHLKVLIVSEEVAKDSSNMRQIIDGLDRNYVINKMVNIMVVKDKAKILIEEKRKARRQETVEGTLYSLLRNEQLSTRFTPKTLTMFISDMDVSKATVVPVGTPLVEEILMSGGAVFKDYALIGYLDEIENRDVEVLNGNIKGDGLDIKFRGANLSLLVTRSKCKKRLDGDPENLKIVYSIEIEGQIHQYILADSNGENHEDLTKEMEKQVENVLKDDVKSTLNKIQKELKADIIGASEYLYKFHPNIWNEIKDDWDNIFPHMEIDVDIKVDIRRKGLVK